MNTTELLQKTESGFFDREIDYLAYADRDTARDRIAKAIKKFTELFGERECAYIISAPGRTELSGNHTDHQGGSVLAASVNLDTLAIVSPRDDKSVTVASEGYEPFTVTLDTLSPIESEKGKSEGIVRGVAAVLSNGCGFNGFDAYTTSAVPKGSGLSSSAAFEVLIGKIFTFLNNKAVTPSELAEAGHTAEVEYFAKPCGKMDQYACATGGAVFLDFKTSDTYSRAIEVDFEAMGYTLVITNAGGSHAHLTPEYASIPEEMKSVARELGGSRLSEIDRTEFFRKFSSLRGRVSDRALSRAMHYYTEIERVSNQAKALESKDIAAYLEGMNGSGDSSLLNLQNIYPTCDTEERSLSLAIGISKLLGAVTRVHGGGFAGTVQALVKNSYAEEYIKEMEKIFGAESAVAIKIRPVGAYVFGEKN